MVGLSKWIFNHTNGNLLAAVLFHTMMNAGAYLFWCCNANWHWPAVLAMAAVVIVIVFGPRNLRRHRAQDRLESPDLKRVQVSA